MYLFIFIIILDKFCFGSAGKFMIPRLGVIERKCLLGLNIWLLFSFVEKNIELFSESQSY